MTNALQDIRIGTMVKGNLPDPAAYVRQILPLGFESIQPFFWQTLGGKDVRRLAGEIRDAIGNADVVVSSVAMFGNPLEDRDLDRETLAGWEALIDNAHLFGTDMVTGFTGRVRGKPLPDSLPRFREVWGELARRAADKGVRIAFENCAMDGNWASGDWNIAHNPDAWELMFDTLPNDNLGLEWEPCHQLVYLIDPIPQIRAWASEDLPRPRQGRDRALGRHPRPRHFRQAALRADAHARLRRQRLGARDQRTEARRLQGRHRHRRLARSGLPQCARDDRAGAGAEFSQGVSGRGRTGPQSELISPGDFRPGHQQHRRQAGIINSYPRVEGREEKTWVSGFPASSLRLAGALTAAVLVATTGIANADALRDKWCGKVHLRFFVGGAEGDAFGTIVYNGAVQAAHDTGAQVDYVFSGWQPEKMIQQLREAVAAKPDGIAMMGHPGDAPIMPLAEDGIQGRHHDDVPERRRARRCGASSAAATSARS